MNNPQILEIATFRLKPGVTEEQLRDAFDACTRFLQRCRGFRGRRLLREPDGELWTELCTWSDPGAARAAAQAFWQDEDAAAFRQAIDVTAPEASMRHMTEFARAEPATGALAFHANLVTARFEDTWGFYTELLGFRTIIEVDGYVHLEHPTGAQLGLMRHELDGDWPELVTGTDGRGMWLSLNVDDADAEHKRLRALGVPIVEPPKDRPWGERCFVVRDPNGVLVFIAHKLVAARVETLVAASGEG